MPLGLMTPRVAAIRSNRKLLVERKTIPDSIIRMAPTINMRRRPKRSAVVVSHREISVSPARVSDRSRPISHPFRPTSAKYSTNTMESRPKANIRKQRVANKSHPSRVNLFVRRTRLLFASRMATRVRLVKDYCPSGRIPAERNPFPTDLVRLSPMSVRDFWAKRSSF